MDILGKANELFEQGKAAVDGNADGKVEAKEVLEALGARAKETVEAGAEALSGIKEGLDVDGDGSVTIGELKVTGEAAVKKAKEAIDGFMGKADDAVDAEAVEVADEVAEAEEAVEADVVEVADEVAAEAEEEVEDAAEAVAEVEAEAENAAEAVAEEVAEAEVAD